MGTPWKRPAGRALFAEASGARGEPSSADEAGRQYFGGDLRSFRAHSGLRLSEVEYGVRRWSEHTHRSAFFALLLRGKYAETLRDRELSYRPFDLGFHPEATCHADRIEAGATKFFLIELDESLVGRLREHAPAAAREPRICAPQDSSLAARLYRAHRAGASYSPLMAEGLVLEMLSGLAPGSRAGTTRRPPRWLRIVLDFLQSEYHRKLALDEIARQVDLHPVYLSRAFPDSTGQSVSQYLTGVRVRFALGRLSGSEVPLADVALRAGFCDQSHFTRVFKRHTGMTPAAFRESSAELRRPRRDASMS
jgi:AraC-like DNA-binding protein